MYFPQKPYMINSVHHFTAALSIDEDTAPRKLDYKLIQKELAARGADLFSK